jgi:hypothetical protein
MPVDTTSACVRVSRVFGGAVIVFEYKSYTHLIQIKCISHTVPGQKHTVYPHTTYYKKTSDDSFQYIRVRKNICTAHTYAYVC